MLMANYLPPSALGISEVEFDALVKVLGMLERGELKHAPYGGCKIPNGFNLGTWRTVSECGTVACLAGWADLLFKTNFKARTMSEGLDGRLNNLFCPAVSQGDVTPAQAAIALRNYLVTGEPKWAEAMASLPSTMREGDGR